MIDIKEIDTLELSNYINIFRQFLVKKDFFEHTLYSFRQFKIENAECFEINPNLFLRYGTEPEIWKIGKEFDKFFWIGSLYRKEKSLSPIHRYEFKLVDFYLREGTLNNILDLFFDLLKEAEKSLNLKKISELSIQFISFKDFQNKKFLNNKKEWIVVTNYPKNESFFDAPLKEGTNKFEIFFISSGRKTEIASGGIVGPNLNPKMYINEGEKYTNEKIFNENFIGLGFGIERLMFLYKAG